MPELHSSLQKLYNVLSERDSEISRELRTCYREAILLHGLIENKIEKSDLADCLHFRHANFYSGYTNPIYQMYMRGKKEDKKLTRDELLNWKTEDRYKDISSVIACFESLSGDALIQELNHLKAPDFIINVASFINATVSAPPLPDDQRPWVRLPTKKEIALIDPPIISPFGIEEILREGPEGYLQRLKRAPRNSTPPKPSRS